MRWKNNLAIVFLTLLLLALSPFTSIHDALGGGVDLPWDKLPQIYGCYKSNIKSTDCTNEGGSFWFFALEPNSRFKVDIASYPVVYRFGLKEQNFKSLAITSEKVPSKVKAYWKEKFREEVEYRTGRRNYISGHNKTRMFKRSGIYEIKRNAILFDDGEEYTLYKLPQVTEEEIRRLVPLLGRGLFGTDNLEETINYLISSSQRGMFNRYTHLGPFVQAEKLYLGLAGGFSEGEGTFGGLAAFDLNSRTWEMIRHPFIIHTIVTDIMFDRGGNSLWIGTTVHWELGESGNHGLLKYNLSTQKWNSYTTRNSGISGDIIRMVRGGGAGVWASTEYGISFFDTKKKIWKSFKWKEKKLKEKTMFELIKTTD